MQTKEPVLGSYKAMHRNMGGLSTVVTYVLIRSWQTGQRGMGLWEVEKLQFAQGIGFRVFADVSPSFYLKPLYGVQSVSIYSSIYLSIYHI